MLAYCSNCPAVWAPGSDDYENQPCGACGWRPGMPTVDDYDDGFCLDDDDDDDGPTGPAFYIT